MSHACGPDCTSSMHEPILERRGNDGLTDTERSKYATAYNNGVGSRELTTWLEPQPSGYDGFGSPLYS